MTDWYGDIKGQHPYLKTEELCGIIRTPELPIGSAELTSLSGTFLCPTLFPHSVSGFSCEHSLSKSLAQNPHIRLFLGNPTQDSGAQSKNGWGTAGGLH